MTRRCPKPAAPARVLTLEKGSYRISQPLGSTPAHASCRLSLRVENGLPVALGNAHPDVADAVVQAFDRPPTATIEDMLAAAGLHVVFDQVNQANGRCRIFARKNARGERMSGEITVADTFVSYLAPRKRAMVHFDQQQEYDFPAWLNVSWRIRAVAAAIAAL